jgi:hypothetical protein
LIEVACGDQQCRIASRRVRIELVQLQFDAFADRARAYARGIHRLYVREDAFDLIDADDEFGLQVAGDLIQRLDDIAIVIQGIDDGSADAHVALAQARHFQLPRQMLLQRLATGIGKVLRVIIAGPWRIGLSGRWGVAPFAIVDGVDFLLGFGSFDGLRGSGRRFELRLDRVAGLQAARFVFRFQHHVGFEGFANLRL